MFDISDLSSIDLIDSWMKDIKEKCHNNLIILLGNKIDLTKHLKGSKALADSLVRKYQLKGYYEISALRSWNIAQIFDDLAHHFQQIFPPHKKGELLYNRKNSKF
jgi:GTPase SAR1 family protein